MSRFRPRPVHKWREVTGEPGLSYKVRHDYTILGYDLDCRDVLDMVVRWAGDGGHCPMHRHIANTTVLVLEGEQHLWDVHPDGDAPVEHRVRQAGDYALDGGRRASPPRAAVATMAGSGLFRQSLERRTPLRDRRRGNLNVVDERHDASSWSTTGKRTPDRSSCHGARWSWTHEQKNVFRDELRDYFAEMMTDELTAELSSGLGGRRTRVPQGHEADGQATACSA